MYETAVFDVDGTLLDTTEGVLAAVRYTIDRCGLQPLPEDVLMSFIGPPIQDSFARAYGLQGDILQNLATVFRNRYKEHDLLKARPYPGIYELLGALKAGGIQIAVATYKRQDYAEIILRHFHFDEYSGVFYGADHENKRKKVDIIRLCLDELGQTDYRKAVMIGDSSHDALGAAKLGMDFLGVTYGFEFRTREDVAKYPSVGSAGTAPELLQYFSRPGGQDENSRNGILF